MKDRQQRIVLNNFSGEWRDVNKGTTQGSVSGAYLFNIFNDLEIQHNSTTALYKYADDSTITSPVFKNSDNSEDLVRSFMDWVENNSMKPNPNKCKELISTKKGQSATPIVGIPQCKELTVLGVTFQNDSRFFSHVLSELVKAMFKER